MYPPIPMLDHQDPLAGIFFLQDKSDVVTRNAIAQSRGPVVATGMGFLLSQEGLVATCTHVIVAMGAKPGDKVTLHSAIVPVSLEATVLPDRWVGPEPGPRGYPEYDFYPGLMDKGLDAYREDVALLQLDLSAGVTRWHTGGDYGVLHGQAKPVRRFDVSGEPLAAVYEYVRVLPLAAPGYRQQTNTCLAAWMTEWRVCQFELHPAHCAFIACERGRTQYNAVLLSGPDIRPGFSGSPLWDTNRERVVGMVRRKAGQSMPNYARATDARFLAKCAGIRLCVDSKFDQFYTKLHAGAAAPPDTDFAAEGQGADTPFVEPRLSLFRPEDPLAQENRHEAVGAKSLIPDVIAASTMSLLVGRAGSGKTTLLYRIAQWCIDEHWEVGNRPLVPVVIKATDLVGLKETLLGLLARLRTRNGLNLDEISILESLEQNDAAVLLLVDGLDEVRSEYQKFAMQRLAEFIRPSGKRAAANDADASRLVHHIIATSRPAAAHQVDAQGRTRHGYQMFELELFDRWQVNDLAAAYFPEQETSDAFLAALNQVGWYREKPTPLQVRLAADLYRETRALPRHARSLTSQIVDLRIAKCAMTRTLLDDGPAVYLDVYCKEVGWMLEFLASCGAMGDEVTLNGVGEQLRRLYNEGGTPAWLTDPVGVLAFIRREAARRTGLFWFHGSDAESPPTLHWFHLTIRELLLARWYRRHLPLQRDALRQCFRARIGDEVELHLLSIFEAERHYDLVAMVLREWTTDFDDSSFRPSKKAMYALGAGIDAGGTMRTALVRKLLHIILCEFDRSYLCRQVYSDQSLPNLLTLVKSPELRHDIVNAFSARFQLRRSRNSLHGSRPVVRPTEREARLMDEADLWATLSVQYELHDPRPDKAMAPTAIAVPAPAAPDMQHIRHGRESDMPGNATTVIMRESDVIAHTIHFDSRHFIEKLTAAARALPDHHGLDLVALIVQIALQADGVLREQRNVVQERWRGH